MKQTALLSIGIVMSAIIPLSSQAQADSAFYNAALAATKAVYTNASVEQTGISNGRQYNPYYYKFTKGFPFFLTPEFQKGSIYFDGGYYDSVSLLYDEIKDLVIIDQGIRMELESTRIDSFTIAGYHFARLIKDKNNKLPGTGFYQVLYGSKTGCYKKEIKKMKENLSSGEGNRPDITDDQYYYILHDGIYYEVRSRSGILNVLKDKKTALQQYISNNNINTKQDFETALPAIVAYYDQLTK